MQGLSPGDGQNAVPLSFQCEPELLGVQSCFHIKGRLDNLRVLLLSLGGAMLWFHWVYGALDVP